MHTETFRNMEGDIELNINTHTTGDTTNVGSDPSPSTSDLHKYNIGHDETAYNVDVESELQYDTEGRVLNYDVGNADMYNDDGSRKIRMEFKRHES